MDRRHFLFASAAASVSATTGAPTALADPYRSLSWPELLPPGEAENLAKRKALIFRRGAIHGSLGDTGPMNAVQPGTFKAVKALAGRR